MQNSINIAQEIDYLKLLFDGCSRGNDQEIVEALANGANPNLYNDEGSTPLIIICANDKIDESKSYKLVERLLQAGANVNYPCRRTGFSALHLAANLNYTKVMQLLLRHGAKIDARADEYNFTMTPLMLAASFSGNIDAIELLVKFGADIDAITHKAKDITTLGRGGTALHFAAEAGIIANFKILLKLGANSAIRTMSGKSVQEAIQLAYDGNKITATTRDNLLYLLSRPAAEIDLIGTANSLSDLGLNNPFLDALLKNNKDEIKRLLETRQNLRTEQIAVAFKKAIMQDNYDVAAQFKNHLPIETMQRIVQEQFVLLKIRLRDWISMLSDYQHACESELIQDNTLDRAKKHVQRPAFFATDRNKLITDKIKELESIIAKLKTRIDIFKDWLYDNLESVKLVELPTLPGLICQEVPYNGHCLYLAVGMYLNRSQEQLRGDVAYHLAHHLEEYREFFQTQIGRLPDDYVKCIREGVEWAANKEIEILMKVFNRPIIVIGKDDGRILNQEVVLRFVGEPIFVLYNGNHYNALIRTGGTSAWDILKNLLQHNIQPVQNKTIAPK